MQQDLRRPSKHSARLALPRTKLLSGLLMVVGTWKDIGLSVIPLALTNVIQTDEIPTRRKICEAHLLLQKDIGMTIAADE